MYTCMYIYVYADMAPLPDVAGCTFLDIYQFTTNCFQNLSPMYNRHPRVSSTVQ